MFEQFPRTEKAGALLAVASNAQRAIGAIDAALLERVVALGDRSGQATVATHDQDGAAFCTMIRSRHKAVT